MSETTREAVVEVLRDNEVLSFEEGVHLNALRTMLGLRGVKVSLDELYDDLEDLGEVSSKRAGKNVVYWLEE